MTDKPKGQMMHSQIEKMLNEVSKLDSWDISAVLGGVNYLLKQAAINATVRKLPDLPEEGSGLENFTDWEAKMNASDIREQAAPMIGVSSRVEDVLNEYVDSPRITTFQDVLKFMTSRPPRRETFEADYNNRKRMGMKPAMPIKEFVDMEMVTALQRHNTLVAKGEAAVLTLEKIDGTDEDLPEWLTEAIHAKALQKLEQRWMRAEMRRTNPRITKNDRDLAQANQKLIEGAIVELGGEIPKEVKDVDNETSEDLDLFIENVKQIALK